VGLSQHQRPAGVDFPYLLYADQVGKPVDRGHARTGVGWLRAVTDVPTAAMDLWDREIDLSSYWRSLRNTRSESVFCARDPLPCRGDSDASLPLYKKYLVKSGGQPSTHIGGDSGVSDFPAQRSAKSL